MLPGGWVGLCLAPLVLIIAGFGMPVGRGVVMGSHQGLVKVLLAPFWISFCCCFWCAARWYSYSTVLFCKVCLVHGHVAGLIAVEVQAVQVGKAEVVRCGVDFANISGSGRKRFRLNRKNPAHLVGHSMHARPRVWKRLHFFWVHWYF